MEAASSSDKDIVPKVHLHATNEKALDFVGMADLNYVFYLSLPLCLPGLSFKEKQETRDDGG